MTLGVVLTEGWRRRSPKPTSHDPGPQPPPEQPPPPPGSWGRGRGALHPWRAPRGRRIQNNTDEARERHRWALGAAPLAGAVLWAERSESLLPAPRDTRAVPKVTRAAFAPHRGIQSLPAGRNFCIPSSALAFGLGAPLLPADVAPWSPRPGVIPFPSPPSLGCSSLLRLGWLSVDAVGSPRLRWSRDGTQDRARQETLGEAWNSGACFAFCCRNVSSFGQRSKSGLLHLKQLWKSLFLALELPVCVWRMLQNRADSAAALEFPRGAEAVEIPQQCRTPRNSLISISVHGQHPQTWHLHLKAPPCQ